MGRKKKSSPTLTPRMREAWRTLRDMCQRPPHYTAFPAWARAIGVSNQRAGQILDVLTELDLADYQGESPRMLFVAGTPDGEENDAEVEEAKAILASLPADARERLLRDVCQGVPADEAQGLAEAAMHNLPAANLAATLRPVFEVS